MNHTVTVFAANVPVGAILMYHGSPDELSDGWKICDGTAHRTPDGRDVATPDLRGRFPLGVDATHPLNVTGGQEQVTLTTNQMPAHNHQGEAAAVAHGTVGNFPRVVKNADWDWTPLIQPSGGSLTLTNVASNGDGQPHDNMPPYRAVHFIIRLW